ncbi:MAG: DDE-type integrase/transposase/recombinase [Deltaproteobacteria bacterium]
MTEEMQKQVAVFRFGIIHDLTGGTRLEHGEREELLREKCDRKWVIPGSARSRISRGTILRWVKLYSESGNKLESLYPKQRDDRGAVRVLDDDTCQALLTLRRQMPKLTVPLLVKTMHERRLVTSGTTLNLTTVYRLLHSYNLMAREQPETIDRRKFEAELPNDLWQSDVMHGPHLLQGGKLRKSYLIAFIDDHSRIIPHGQFYHSEALMPFLDAFATALKKRGLPVKLYVDNGSAFRSRHLEYTCASLGISLIHARPYTPQGKGKIERFFKSVRSRFLPGFKGTTLQEINEAFAVWLEQEYHQRIHGAIGQTPFARFTRQMHCLRAAPENLMDHFRTTVRRRVNKDRSVIINRRLYEAPVALIGKRVEILYHDDTPELVEIRSQGESFGLLRQVDLHVNSRVKRGKCGEVKLSDTGTDNDSVNNGTDDLDSGQLWGDA